MDASGSSSSSGLSSPESEKQNEKVNTSPEQTMYFSVINNSLFFTPEPRLNQTYSIIETPMDSNPTEREGGSNPKSSKKLPIQKLLAKMAQAQLNVMAEVENESSCEGNANHANEGHSESMKRVPSVRRPSKIPILARPRK